MNLLKYIFLMFVFTFPLSLAAQDNPKHPIDIAREKRGTFPQAKCYSAASEMWEKAVVTDYQKLLDELSPELRKVLVDEQTAWEQYRSKNQDFVMAKYGSRRGSGYISVRIVLLMQPNKERALELENRFLN